jgi:phage shock protein PspC (stress-responsive transcriptional regulator)
MKKTIHIHLGGMPFVIDEDAFNTLSSYLQKLKDKFTNELEQKEILEDIETRIAEVFSSKMNKGKQVVELTDVLAVIDQLGKPEEIDEPSSESSFTSEPNFESKSEKQFTTNGSKKLFRDEENKIFGGVIIGLCHYFGIAEPLWARLAFVFLLWLSFGTVMLGYFILWLLIPAAKTYADKLQMKGEPVTLDTIEKEVKSAFLKVDEQFGGGAKGVESFLVKIVSVVKLLLKGVLKIVAAIVLFISFFFLMAYLSMLSGFSVLGTGHLQDYLHLFVDSKTTYWLAAIMTLFAFGIPLFWVMYSAASFLFSLKLKLPKSIMLASLVLWLCSIVGVGTIKMKVFSNFATKNHATEEVAILQPTSNTLYLLPKEDTSLYVEKVHISIDEDDMEFDLSNALLEKTENGFLVGNAMVDIQPSKDEKFHLTKTISAKGNSRANAKKYCHQLYILPISKSTH